MNFKVGMIVHFLNDISDTFWKIINDLFELAILFIQWLSSSIVIIKTWIWNNLNSFYNAITKFFDWGVNKILILSNNILDFVKLSILWTLHWVINIGHFITTINGVSSIFVICIIWLIYRKQEIDKKIQEEKIKNQIKIEEEKIKNQIKEKNIERLFKLAQIAISFAGLKK